MYKPGSDTLYLFYVQFFKQYFCVIYIFQQKYTWLSSLVYDAQKRSWSGLHTDFIFVDQEQSKPIVNNE